MKTYGTPANPFPELPPAASLAGVAWAGGAVKWPTSPFSFLSAALPPIPPPNPDPDVPPPRNPRADSYTGTASFWLRIEGSLTDEARIPLIYVAGPRVFETYSFEGADHNIYTGNVPDIGFLLDVSRDPVSGALVVTAALDRMPNSVWYIFQVSSRDAFGEEPSFPGDIANNKWAYFLITWDAESVAGTLLVNKTTRPAYFNIQGTELVDVLSDTSRPYAPIRVPWSETPRFFGASLHYEPTIPGAADNASIGPADPLTRNHLISLAHVWVSTSEIITDPSLFADADGKPAKLGKEHEVIFRAKAIKPDFYFSGGPKDFIINKGGGGETTLAGEPPITQSIQIKIGV